MLINLTDALIPRAEDLEELPVLFRLVGNIDRVEDFADAINVLGVDTVVLDVSDEYLEVLSDLVPDVELIDLATYLESSDEVDRS
jgi:hypothetical protein